MAKSLTPLTVKNARPDPQKRREIPDGRGLYLVIQKSGAKSWAYRYRFNGKPAKLTLGPAYIPGDEEEEPETEPKIGDALTLKQARELMAKVERQRVRKVDPAGEVRARRRGSEETKSETFDGVAREFLRRYAQPKTRDSTYRETVRLLGFELHGDALELRTGENWLGPAVAWQGRPVREIRRRDLVSLLDGIEDNRSASAADGTLAAVRRLFNWAVEREAIPDSPAVAVKRRTEVGKRDRVLNDEELRLVWLASGEVGWPFGPLVRLLILTGCRRDEWAEARWSEIHTARKVLELPGERTKNGTAHAVPLSAQALGVLEDLKQFRLDGTPDWVFSTGYRRSNVGGKPSLAPISGFSKAKTRLDLTVLKIAREEAREAGLDPADIKPLPDWRLHDLRRTAVTGMARLGVPIEVIERSVNHVSGSFAGVVGVYQRHTYSAEIRQAIEAWAAGVARVASGEPLVVPKVIPMSGRRRGRR